MGNCVALICHAKLKETRIRLQKISFSQIFSDQNGYAEDEGGNVTGLNLAGRRLKNRDIIFLKDFNTIRSLNLSNNSISDISPLSSLTALTQLDLSQNKIIDITCLNHLQKLERLNLDNNKIATLPRDVLDWGMEIRLESGLQSGLTLKGNPLLPSLSEAIARGRKALVSYFATVEPVLPAPTGRFPAENSKKMPLIDLPTSTSGEWRDIPRCQERKRILILAANPQNKDRVRFEEEIREIEDGLKLAGDRDRFELKYRLAVRFQDLRKMLVQFKPQIVHFIGHGDQYGIQIEDEPGHAESVSTEVLSQLLGLCSDSIECVILNACYTAAHAQAISRSIEYVIGMRNRIPDKAAIHFSVAFYDGIIAGWSVEKAFELGCITIKQKYPDSPAHFIPFLKKRQV